jgi:protein gp37
VGDTSIQWTDKSWNPVRGCSRVSEGCRNCYAEKVAARFSDKGQAYEGLATRSPARWTGEVRLIEEHLEDPLKWKRPRRIFVNSMSDLFHEGLSDADIDRVFAVMALAGHHKFQVLTKRAARLRRYFAELVRVNPPVSSRPVDVPAAHRRVKALADEMSASINYRHHYNNLWPLPNVWLGVSTEDQKTADERIPLLLQTPAAVRFISAEPLLSPVNLYNYLDRPGLYDAAQRIDWVIVGGESGPEARPFELSWARSLVGQCRVAGVACFMKQLGARPFVGTNEWHNNLPLRSYQDDHALPGKVKLALRDHKGGAMEEWPEDLRVREFPAA